MNEVFLKTRELGEAILKSEEFALVKKAEEKAMKNTEAAETMGKYLEAKGEMDRMMAMGVIPCFWRRTGYLTVADFFFMSLRAWAFMVGRYPLCSDYGVNRPHHPLL